MPLALTDEQLRIVLDFAEPLNPQDRSAYLVRVAALLGDRELGDGVVHKMARVAQGEFKRLPAQINGRLHDGKYA
jgi:hypothetical protein